MPWRDRIERRRIRNDGQSLVTADERSAVVVLTNMPDRDSARRLAEFLVNERHAACVNILADCTSTYRWEGKVETATEVPMLIKTSASAYAALERSIREHHPYQVPEILSFPVENGLPAYLEWIATEAVAH